MQTLRLSWRTVPYSNKIYALKITGGGFILRTKYTLYLKLNDRRIFIVWMNHKEIYFQKYLLKIITFSSNKRNIPIRTVRFGRQSRMTKITEPWTIFQHHRNDKDDKEKQYGYRWIYFFESHLIFKCHFGDFATQTGPQGWSKL